MRLLALALWVTSLLSESFAQDITNEGVGTNPSKYVNITFEVYGLEESVKALQSATTSLEETLNALKSQKGRVSSQDLKRVERIAEYMTEVSHNINRSILDIGPSIEKAKNPTVELVSAVAKETKTVGIDPIVAEFQTLVSDSVRKMQWAMIWVGITFFVGVVVLGVFFFKIFKQINGLATTAREALTKGEFIFKLKDEVQPEVQPELLVEMEGRKSLKKKKRASSLKKG